MDRKEHHQPPRLAMAFFRWFCQPALREEIEGDLLEQYHKQVTRYGIKKADRHFTKSVLLLFRPTVIGNLHHLTQLSAMKKFHWLLLIAANLLVAVCIFLPFIPGPYDELSVGLSGMAQVAGIVGLPLVPIGLLWLINGRNAYYYAIAAICLGILISLFFMLSLLLGAGPSAAIALLLVVIAALWKWAPMIKKLKQGENKPFTTAPLYLLSIPLIAFTVRLLFITPVSNYSRDHAIEQAQSVINAIESYHTQKGSYPESIEYLYDLPAPSVMGIDGFRYEKNGNGYNLSFIQWQHVLATKEVVMYNKNDEHNVKGHFASYPAKQPHWKYYWLD
ncbi:hypothetical protein HB364_06920 [Pseudoflavitalea sp. X16]|uniref:permease prefix domain 2-containing transporter n=1 Tax=Paraflavitalea devenefica TaxID=2716334 RepID=UPI001421C6EA|nr:permease prefix domain 2-containing transporter [Paraflavitalea devenefica]NII24802.1 hypothetical protein [Paraflavitalea devenefica]